MARTTRRRPVRTVKDASRQDAAVHYLETLKSMGPDKVLRARIEKLEAELKTKHA